MNDTKDTNNKITTVEANDKLNLKQKLKLPALHARLQQQAQAPNVLEIPNRIMLMPDCSGSMASRVSDERMNSLGSENNSNFNEYRTKIDILKDAVDGFLNNINWQDTAVGIRNFGLEERDNQVDCDLLNVSAVLHIHAMSLLASGGTPMGHAMQKALEQPLTRGVIISDGDATDGDLSLTTAEQYREAGVPVDCIHIGDSHHGEERMQKIAEVTNGIYAKISDASKLVGALKYLTPTYRALLTSGEATIPGADEVRK